MGRYLDQLPDISGDLALTDEVIMLRPDERGARAPLSAIQSLIGGGGGSSVFNYIDLAKPDASGWVRLTATNDGGVDVSAGTGESNVFDYIDLRKPDSSGYVRLRANNDGGIDYEVI